MIEILRAQFLDTVAEQLKDNNPPAVLATYQRLQQLGYNEVDARNLIASCMAAEMFDMIEENRMFQSDRYEELLLQLPELPFPPEAETK